MSANLYRPHLQVLLEDDANRQIVLGFINHLSINSRQMPLDEVAGGWQPTLERFRDVEITKLRSYPHRRVLIVIDFDRQPSRFEEALNYIPKDLRERVYVIGSEDEPEALIRSLGRNKEQIGYALAEDCEHGTRSTWGHSMLKHNESELKRLWTNVRPFLIS